MSDCKLSWFKHDLDYQLDSDLTCLLLEHGLEAEGVYWRVVTALYRANSSLPLDKILYVSTGVSNFISFEEFEKIIRSMIILGLLEKRKNGELFSKRIEKDKKLRETRRNSASKGGRKTQSKQATTEFASSTVLQATTSSNKKEEEEREEEGEGEREGGAGGRPPKSPTEKFHQIHLQKISASRKTNIGRYPEDSPPDESCVYLTTTEFEKLAKDFGSSPERDYWIAEVNDALLDAIKAHPKSAAQKTLCDRSNHSKVIRNWRKREVARDLEFFEHPIKGPGYYYPSVIRAAAKDLFQDFALDTPLSQQGGIDE